MSRSGINSFVIVSILSVQMMKCSVNETAVEVDKFDPRFVPPPPPFAPPLLFPVNAATGILVAIAVPVPLPDQNVFVSYNFEANYNMPNIPSDSFPGPLVRLKLRNPYPSVDPAAGGTVYDVIARKLAEDFEDSESEETTTAIPDKHEIMERSLSDDRMVFTRSGAYRLIESRLNANGIIGKSCLLLAICETARFPFLENNGVVGHVLHIVLTPSSSMDENLSLEYEKAEMLGHSGNCRKYEKQCNCNILDLISKIV